MLATQYAEWYGIEAQQEGESDSAFVYRLSGELRNQGLLIEAHEVQAGKRWDEDGSTAITGVVGALTMALQDVDYGTRGSSRVGDEIAVGTIVQTPEKPSMSPDEVMIYMALFG